MLFTSSKAYFPCDVDVPVEMSAQEMQRKRNMDALKVSKDICGHKKPCISVFSIGFQMSFLIDIVIVK